MLKIWSNIKDFIDSSKTLWENLKQHIICKWLAMQRECTCLGLVGLLEDHIEIKDYWGARQLYHCQQVENCSARGTMPCP